MCPASPAVSDEDLVRATLAGRQEAFGELVERYQSRLVNFLFRIVRNADEAHDLAQEVFVKVYQALDRFDPRYRFSTWIFRVAQNAAIDLVRRRRYRMVSLGPQDDGGEDARPDRELPANDPGAEAGLVERETAGQVREAITRLPWEYRELILLRHYGELSYDEIAEAKGMPLGTVKNKLFRARQLLRALLGGEDPRRVTV